MRLPDGFLDGAEVILSGRARAGLALAVVVAGALHLSAPASGTEAVLGSPVEAVPHFSLVGTSPSGDRVRLVGSGGPEAVGRLQAVLEDYARDGNAVRVRDEAILESASMSVTPLATFSGHDSRNQAMAVIATMAFTGSMRPR